MKRKLKKEPTNEAGFDEIYVHSVGRNQEEFIKGYG